MNTPSVVSALDVRRAKRGRKLVMITAYDAPTAALADAAGVDMLLVGDSVGMAVLGRRDTLSVTMEEMLHHCRAVSAAGTGALVVGDMPFMSYESGRQAALANAGRLMAEGGVRAVKLEGGAAVASQIRALTSAGIPVMGHVGLTPQRMAALGGFKVQGKTAKSAAQVLRDALAVQEAGCFAVVLECLPSAVAAEITARLEIPTIGIGAGAGCDGQVLVFHDALGLNQGHCPKFVKKYADLSSVITEALGAYAGEVREGAFPDAARGFSLPEEEQAHLEKELDAVAPKI